MGGGAASGGRGGAGGKDSLVIAVPAGLYVAQQRALTRRARRGPAVLDDSTWQQARHDQLWLPAAEHPDGWEVGCQWRAGDPRDPPPAVAVAGVAPEEEEEEEEEGHEQESSLPRCLCGGAVKKAC